MPLHPRDVDELVDFLDHREYPSLPFELFSDTGSRTPAELRAACDAAIIAANEQATVRRPDDPTSSQPADLVDGRVVVRLDEGSLEQDEVRAWFADLGLALDAAGVAAVRLAPYVANESIPNIDAWMTRPPVPTAFLFFTDPETSRTGRRIATATILEMADPLVSWSRVPGGTVVVRKGLTEVVVPATRAAEVLTEGMPIEPPQFGIRQFTLDPPRQRSASFTYDARGELQVVEEAPAADLLTRLLDGVRPLGHALDYAYVRRATPVSPSEWDTSMVLGRPMTNLEMLAADGSLAHLLPSYVPDVYVAQVLTDAHLSRSPDLSAFVLEDLGSGRHLVRARDLDAWLTGLNPEAAVAEDARRAFGALLMTEETYTAAPAPWTR